MKLLRLLYVLIFGFTAAFVAKAFAPETYAEKSVLASGKWVKISVKESGMHCISPSTLSKWGFSNPSAVRVYGYGGAMLPDMLSLSGYIDDLPRVASTVTAKGLVFYAEGPEQINLDDRGEAYHSVNPYSNYGYYFLTEAADGAAQLERGGTALSSSANCLTSGSWVVYYDPQQVSLGNTGRMMVGEDFRTQRTRTFDFDLTSRTAGTQVLMRLSVVANVSGGRTNITLTANGEKLPQIVSKDYIEACSDKSGYYATSQQISKTFTPDANKVSMGLTMSTTGIMKAGWLDYMELVYNRAFAGSQILLSAGPEISSAGAVGSGRHVWDVTDPANQYELNVGPTGAWRNDRAGVRRYAVWGEADAMPEPEFAGNIYNQNLHAMTTPPDMVIITPSAYIKSANAIADIHRNYALDPLRVEVVNLDYVLNEFGSGCFDPGALRRFLKMLYDRNSSEGKLRYALMFGKGTCDNRALTMVGKGVRAPMPLWTSENSLNESSSFSTDDYFGFLEDNSGARPGTDKLSVAVGRIPVTSAAQAATAADKIQRYLYSMPRGNWRTRMTVLADDENNGDHTIQSEKLLNNLTSGLSGSRIVADKIYCDAYVRSNSTYPQARADLFSNFNDGMAIFAFIGHGSPTALGSKNIIQPVDFRNRFFFKQLPFFYAATCSFLKWDCEIVSQAEELMFMNDGGIIGCISALRPVYITLNGNLSAAFGRVLSGFDESGRVPTIGEIYRRSKNALNDDTNKLRYVLMGDPALRLVFPSNMLTVDEINGAALTADEPYTAMARQNLIISGRVTDAAGNMLSDFNGMVTATLYDAEFSTTSFGYGGGGGEVTFEEIGDRLFTATGKAENGRYEIKVRMPRNIADNYRPATLSLYANSTAAGDLREAAGLTRNIYAFGFDDSTPDDSEPPVIHYALLNDDNFSQGADVNPSPLLVARLSDNTGLNMSSAGVGQKMTITVDGHKTYNDVASAFVHDPTPQAGAMSGTLYYQIPEMAAGEHSLTLRVWDIDGNFTDAVLRCNVRSDLKPEIYEVYTNDSPARSEARFFVRHNRPDQIVNVRVAVYDLMGRHVWSGETQSRSDMETSSSVVWDLRNEGGQRVPRGIYIYRVELADGSVPASKTKKLAVAAND